jgi:predicted  nucleic acid-binding Zn-ribbon protein
MDSGSKILLLKIDQLDKRILELEEIETDLTSTLSYAEMGVATWKTRAEELEQKVDDLENQLIELGEQLE